jgi:hypothetical protein
MVVYLCLMMLNDVLNDNGCLKWWRNAWKLFCCSSNYNLEFGPTWLSVDIWTSEWWNLKYVSLWKL